MEQSPSAMLLVGLAESRGLWQVLKAEGQRFFFFLIFFFFKLYNFYLFIYLFIFGCVGSSFLCEGFL